MTQKRMTPFSGLKIYGLGAGALRGGTKEIDELIDSDVTDITFGSYLYNGAPGNKPDADGSVVWYLPDGAIGNNAFGMKGEPISAYIPIFERIYEKTKAAGIEFHISIASTNTSSKQAMIEENVKCCELTSHCCDGWEDNEGCPNILGKPIQGYDSLLVDAKLSAFERFGKRFRIKLPNYMIWTPERWKEITNEMQRFANSKGYWINISDSDFTRSSIDTFNQICEVIKRHPNVVQGLVGPNTLPLVEVIGIANEKAVLSYNGGNTKGGLSGKILSDMAFDQIKALRKAFPTDMDIIGMGCGSDGIAIQNLIRAGANGVLFTTGYIAKGPSVFGEALAEYATQ